MVVAIHFQSHENPDHKLTDILRKKVKSKTRVPVPRILAWSSKPEGGMVGIEYIIMEHVSGVTSKGVWSQMTELQHVEFIESMGGLVKELCYLDFGALGSLYLNVADGPQGRSPSIKIIASVHTVADNSGVTTTIRQSNPRFPWVSKVHVSVMSSTLLCPYLSEF